MYQQSAQPAAPLYAASRAAPRAVLSPEEQEAEDHRLALQLQREEEERELALRAEVETRPRSHATAGGTRRPTSQQAAPIASTRAPVATDAEDDADYMLALQLAGDTPQDYAQASTGSSATFVRPSASATTATHAPTPASTQRRAVADASIPPSAMANRDPRPRSTTHARAVPVSATTVVEVSERMMTREEQEAEDLRLALEIQQLEEAAAMREGIVVPPRSTSSFASAPPATHPPRATSESVRTPPAVGAASVPQSRATDLFSTIALPPNSPGVVGRAPMPAVPVQPKRDLMDELFAPPPPQPPQPVQAAAAVATSSSLVDDFFAPAQPAPLSTAPPNVWSTTAPVATAASHSQPPRDVMDDLFGAPVHMTSAPPGGAKPSQATSAPPPAQGDHMAANLDFFAATVTKPPTRAW